VNAEHKQRVLEIYARADADVRAAGPRCDASGRCCRFKEYDHTLFISQLEADVLLDACPPYETPVGGEFCPFQIDGLCTARDPRPLGCRVYFCDPAYQETGVAISERYLAELKRLSEETGTPWNYAPLHRHLNAGTPRGPATPTPDGRLPLTLLPNGQQSR
jgi:Fe-S-cluster containining protein